MGGVIDQARKHFGAYGVQKMEVPEWGDPPGPNGEPGKPLIVRFMPLTLDEKQKHQRARENEGYITAFADLLIMKCLNEDGSKMFTIDDKFALKHHVDPDVISRIVLRITAMPNVEEKLGNSSGTPTST